MPSVTRSRVLVPVRRRKARALPTARGRRLTAREPMRLVDQVGADHPLGRAVEGLGHDRVGDLGDQVALLDRVRHPALGGEQEAGAHGDAVGAVGQGGHQAPTVVEAAGAQDRDLGARPRRPRRGAGGWWARGRCGRRPRPPGRSPRRRPSPSIFSAWRRAPTVGITRIPWSWRRAMASSPGAPAKDTSRTPSSATKRMRSSRSGWSARKFTPKGASVLSLTARTARRSWSGSMVTAARMPNPPAALVAAVRLAPDTHPIPVWTIGCRHPSRSVRRVGRAEPWTAQGRRAAGQVVTWYQPRRHRSRGGAGHDRAAGRGVPGTPCLAHPVRGQMSQRKA